MLPEEEALNLKQLRLRLKIRQLLRKTRLRTFKKVFSPLMKRVFLTRKLLHPR
jgi:hypothetical protein